MKAKEYLRQIKKLDRMIENKLIEREQWLAIATSTTSQMKGDVVQASGSQQKMSDAVVRYIDLEEEIDRMIDQLIDKKCDVISVIEMLNATEYDLIHKVYVQFIPLDVVAERYNKSYRWAITIHGRALKNIQKILDERKDNK